MNTVQKKVVAKHRKKKMKARAKLKALKANKKKTE